MLASKISDALASLQEEVSTFERVLAELIGGKRNMVSTQSSKKPLVAVNKINTQLQQTPIAVVGMAGIFPKSKNLQEYWENIVHEVDCITDVPSTHWDVEAYYDPDPRAVDKTYCKRGGFIPDIDFNPMEFGLPPNLLEVTDISQLLSLVVAKQAMEDAGYGQSSEFDREHTGVILGAVGRQLSAPLSARLQYPIWERVLKNSGVPDEDTQKIVEKIKLAYVRWEENSFPGMLSNVISGRIANRFDFGGTNCTIDAACASSLAAFKMAISELVEGRCRMMLTGGIDTDNSAFTYLCFSKTPALSRKQQTKPFDAESDGMMLGEGLGMVVLKRLEDAERDQDKIYAVIRGIGTSSDGRYKSIYAPRPEGQVKALRRAYEAANISPASVGLIEAHGTGTMAGDPAEFTALNDVFSQGNPNKQHIALGSVKSQIGHTKTAAGVASVIKAALALHHKILPATINITNPNPKLNIEDSPFYLNTKTRPWLQAAEDSPRRAGVSSFGFGGTNFHIVLEEYQDEHNQRYRLHRSPKTLLLVAETPEQLLEKCETALQQLQNDSSDRPYIDLTNRCQSLQVPTTSARVGFVAASQSEACSKLQTTIKLLKSQASTSWEHPQGIYYRPSGMELNGKVVALFSGQGSQYLEMGRELVMNFPVLRQSYDHMDKLFANDGLQPISTVVFPSPAFQAAQKDAQTQRLQRTEYAQPAIGVFSVGLYKIMQQAGFKPDFVAGHSFGEFTALWAAGALSDEDYFSLIKARGKAMATPTDVNGDAGTMLAVKSDADSIKELIKPFQRVAIANYNSNKQVVLSGSKSEIGQVQQILSDQGYSVIPLPVSGAFHTPLVTYAQKPFTAALESIPFKTPKIPVYSNVTSDRYPTDSQAIQGLLKKHLINPVLFKQEIENIYAAGGACFVEFGSKGILTNLVQEILGDRPHLAIALNASRQKDSDRQLREAVVQLQVAGLALDSIDPYELEPQIIETTSDQKLSFRLNGASYISDKTKMEFEKALQDGHQVKPLIAQPEQPVLQSVQNQQNGYNRQNGKNGQNGYNGHNDDYYVPHNSRAASHQPDSVSIQQPVPAIATPLSEPIPTLAMSKPSLNYQRALDSVEYALTQFNQHQGETLQVHKQYLTHQMEYAKIFFQLMQQQNELLLNPNAASQPTETKTVVLGSLERNMMRFHDHQAETLRAHEQSLNHQLEYSKNFFQLVQRQYDLLTVSSSNARHIEPTQTVDIVADAQNSSAPAPITDIIAEPQNGSAPVPATQPTPAFELPVTSSPVLNGNGTGNSKHEASQENGSSISDVRSNLSYTNGKQAVKALELEAPVLTEETPLKQNQLNASVAGSTSIPVPSSSIDHEALSQTLLAIVSEKTGYPTEMLEMEMDMESDLGIDSIKRVEILGAFMEKFPELPQPKLEEMAELELRTLGQVTDYMGSLAAGCSNHIATSTQDHAIAPVPAMTEITDAKKPIPTNTVDLTQEILSIVSERTGYPVDTLDMRMDLENDLGIDPVNRVELLDALADKLFVLPQSASEEINTLELQTLEQMVEYIQSLAQRREKKTISTNRLMVSSLTSA